MIKKFAVFILLLIPNIVNAQPNVNDWGYNELATGNIALGTRDLRSTIAGVINIVLGFLGVLTTIAIIWGGINMMTSYGNSEKSEKGRNAIVAGFIGLLIVLTAYAISRFVLTNIANQTI